MEVSANRWHPWAFDAQSYGFRRTVARSPFWHTSVTASSPAPKGVSTRSHCKLVRKECGRTAGPTFDTCRSSEGVDVASLKNRSGDPQITHIQYPRRSCRRSLMQTAISETETKSLEQSLCVHHSTLSTGHVLKAREKRLNATIN